MCQVLRCAGVTHNLVAMVRLLRFPLLMAILPLLLLSACSEDTDGPTMGPERTSTTTTTAPLPEVAPLTGLDIEVIASDLDEPVALGPAPGIDELFIVQRTGRLVTASSGGTSAVLDLTSDIAWEVNEQGFLNFAVHPSFPDTPLGYAIYTNRDFDVVVSSFEWTGAVFDKSSEREILIVPQPHKWHQGGGMLFGPYGNLWLSFGDGGGIGDRFDNGQNPKTLNGTILRIDVDNGDPYAYPPDNPFLDRDEGLPEIWAYGLRNPWRFAIDGSTIIIADVGQETAEEINVASIHDGGLNFGWSVMEGFGCYDAEACDDTGMTAPVVALDRDTSCAIIGGPVYRGVAIPEMHGHYVFADYCRGWIRSMPLVDGQLGEMVDWEPQLGRLGNVAVVGTDQDGELVVTLLDGTVGRIVPVR